MIAESPRLSKVFGTGKSTPLLPTVNDFRGQPTDNLHCTTGSFGMPMNAMESSMAPSGCDVLKSVPLANGASEPPIALLLSSVHIFPIQETPFPSPLSKSEIDSPHDWLWNMYNKCFLIKILVRTGFVASFWPYRYIGYIAVQKYNIAISKNTLRRGIEPRSPA